VRRAIGAAFAVVLIGSPRAGESRYVSAEIAIAQSKSVAVVPVWVLGESWIDCVPLQATGTQYIDFRDNASPARAARTLVATLEEIIVKLRPRHTVVDDPFGTWYDKSVTSSPEFVGIPGYVSICLDRPPHAVPRDQRLRKERMVAMRHDAYESLQELLDDLYMNYLSPQFAPLSYGSSWLLYEDELNPAAFESARVRGLFRGIHPSRFILPWSWLKRRPPASVSDIDPYWARCSLNSYYILPKSILEVRQPQEDDYPDLADIPRLGDRAYGMAINDNALWEEVMTGPGKQPHPPLAAGFLEIVDIDEIEESGYRHLIVADDNWRRFAGKALRETELRFDTQ